MLDIFENRNLLKFKESVKIKTLHGTQYCIFVIFCIIWQILEDDIIDQPLIGLVIIEQNLDLDPLNYVLHEKELESRAEFLIFKYLKMKYAHLNIFLQMPPVKAIDL